MTYSPEALISPRFSRAADHGVVSPNERALLRLIWRNPGMARSEITPHIDLTQQSIYRIIDQLAERGIVALGAPKPGVGRGQPSPTLRLDGRHAYSCGISVNTDVIGICLMDLAGRILGETSVPLRRIHYGRGTRPRGGGSGWPAENQRAFRGLLLWHRLCHCRLSRRGTRYNAPLPLHEWSLIELGPLMADFFGRPVWVHNGANTATIAESMFGVGRYIKHFAYLSFNYGFGGGLISDGELLLGGNGNAGRILGYLRRGRIQAPPGAAISDRAAQP
ncbi:ROK family transcriptional regulator (plasmid) [Devosia sp. A8/3-2]|nr:ROK family transcriptional regulator [Devosia sp. A8/3-2]